jgi:hypothetical protein
VESRFSRNEIRRRIPHSTAQRYQLDDSTGNYNFSQVFTSSNPFASSSTTGNYIASFLLGLPSSGTMGQGLYLALQRKYWAGFVQDRWKLTRTLTLNLGFRYEVEVPPTERHNYQSYFDFRAMAPIVQQAGLNNPGALLPVTSQMRSPENTYYRQVGPRFGFAWQATGQTVLRGGYGILWLPGGIEITGASSNNPTSSISTALVSSLDNGVTPFARLSNPFQQGLIPPGNGQGANSLIGQSVTAYNRGQHSGYNQQWNFDIQRQITSSFMADVAYAGSHSIDLPANLQINQLPNQYLSLGTALTQQVPNPFYGLVSVGTLAQPTVSRGQLLRPYPQFNGVTLGYTSLGNSIYHSLQAKLSNANGRAHRLGLSDHDRRQRGGRYRPGAERRTRFQDNIPGSTLSQYARQHAPPATCVHHRAPRGQREEMAERARQDQLAVFGLGSQRPLHLRERNPVFLGTSTNLTNSFGAARPNNNGTSAALSGRRKPIEHVVQHQRL